ncbi:hypothetical protein NP233_g12089 [Leucocoprinus birnbaumii]|uniref:Reverse transcriptase Ty1/copia-type domain-containing protein n=1 Tax=Leucocoprinus birnbaumii TaxID=56174 RepID=A0AAD5YJS2_9AGAR|nr:hypothetical protein NP233_g12089 [Leucocoprinus birnbaumii]
MKERPHTSNKSSTSARRTPGCSPLRYSLRSDWQSDDPFRGLPVFGFKSPLGQRGLDSRTQVGRSGLIGSLGAGWLPDEGLTAHLDACSLCSLTMGIACDSLVKGNAADADFELVEFAGNISSGDPRTYKATMSAPDAEKWKEACNLKILTLIANGTWELVELPPGAKVVDSGAIRNTPVLTTLRSLPPTFCPASLRLIVALAAKEGYKMRSVDISSAFTYGELDEVIYMKQPEGYHQGGPNVVCILHKSLYGLKQSARQWNKKLHSVLDSLGFKRLQSDASL